MDFDLEKIYLLPDNISPPILAVDTKCRLLLLNDATCRLAGVSKQDVSLQPLSSLSAFSQLSSVCRLKGQPKPQNVFWGSVYPVSFELLE